MALLFPSLQIIKPQVIIKQIIIYPEKIILDNILLFEWIKIKKIEGE